MKSRMATVVNKKKFKQIKFNYGGDGCDPTLNGIHLNEKNVPKLMIPFGIMIQYLKQKKLLLKTDLDLLGRGIELMKAMVIEVVQSLKKLLMRGLK